MTKNKKRVPKSKSAKLRMAVRMQNIAQSVTGWNLKQIETANKWLKLNEGEK